MRKTISEIFLISSKLLGLIAFATILTCDLIPWPWRDFLVISVAFFVGFFHRWERL